IAHHHWSVSMLKREEASPEKTLLSKPNAWCLGFQFLSLPEKYRGFRGEAKSKSVGLFQTLMSRQNSKMEELLQKIKQQQYRMDKQNLQIKSLQSKVNMLLPLHIKGSDMEASKWKGSLQGSPDRPANQFPAGCHQIFLDGGQSSGVYQIQPPGSPPFEVFCDMTPGGWWFSTCGHVNLNGKYFRSIPRQRHERKQGIFWKTWKGRYYPLRATAMKIRPSELGAAS
ncbi:hypothetical protein JD844_034359, partial [Phrynosoma platyrhinos]